VYRTVEISDVKSSRPKWPRGQNFGLGLGLKHFGLGLASISLSYYAIGHFSGKNRVKFGNFVNFFTARCTLAQSVVLRSHVVCLSVCPSVTLVNC